MGDDYPGIYVRQNSLNCTTEMDAFNVNYTSHLLDLI